MRAGDLIGARPGLWEAATRHRFLDEVGEGTLEGSRFDRWLVQDHLFVEALVRAQARITAGAPRKDLALLAGGMAALVDELAWFEEVAADRDLELGAEALPAARAYVDFLHALTYRPYPVQATTLWAVERAYLEAWQSAAPASGPYRPFVEHWTTEAFRTYVAGLETVADRELGGAGEDERAEAGQAFGWVARYERDFWQMAYGS